MNKATNSSALVIPPGGATNGVPQDIRGIKDPVEIASTWVWVAWLLGAAALLALIWWVWKKRRRKAAEPAPAAVIPPHEKARERLREALALIAQPRPFCIAVSDTVRVYLEERFSLHAPERTTEEFLGELQTSQVLTYDQKQTLAEFLERCDLVKFARYEPSRAELEALYQAAVRLIEETEPVPAASNTPGRGAKPSGPAAPPPVLRGTHPA